MTKPSKVAIIPARGGSKRIPGKNLRLFLDKPIIAYSIAAATEAGVFDRIVVSTDSEEIAKVAESYGAEAPFRRDLSLADEFTPTAPVILDALARLESMGQAYSHVCCLYATAPLLRSRDISDGFRKMTEAGSSGAFSVTSYAHPIFRALKINSSGHLEMFWPEHKQTRSNDLPEAFHDAGQFYWREVSAFRRDQTLWASDAVPLVLPRKWVQDIDTPEDWERAELLYRMREKMGG